MSKITIVQWQNEALHKLKNSKQNDPFLDPKIDILLMLEFVLQKNKAFIHAFNENYLTEIELLKLNQILNQRLEGKPMAYILGYKSFYKFDFLVNENVLIPRPETEILVEKVLEFAFQFDKQNLKILDLGTGSGAIACSVANELPNSQIIAVDKSVDALKVAKTNAKNLNLKNVNFIQSSWFDALNIQNFDIIVSNPPYISSDDPHLSFGDVQFEPKSALIAENNGLKDLLEIIQSAPKFLISQGSLLLEHGYQQAKAVREIFHNMKIWRNIHTIKDYSANDRITIATKI